MSRAVYDAQRDWKDVRFLLLEAEPVSESGRSRLRGNTESLEIDVSEAGYLAGYAAVQAGYTHLAISDRKTKRTEQSTGQVMHSVQRRPLRIWDLEKTASRWIIRIGKAAAYHRRIWKKSKAGMVRADRFSSRTVHRIRMYLAQQHLRQAELIANGGVEEYANAVLKVRLDYGTAVYNALKEMKQKDFEGGKIVTRGVTDQEISLEWNQDAVPYFTEDQYRALCAKFSAEDFSIPDGDALSSPDQYKLSCVSVQKVK